MSSDYWGDPSIRRIFLFMSESFSGKYGFVGDEPDHFIIVYRANVFFRIFTDSFVFLSNATLLLRSLNWKLIIY